MVLARKLLLLTQQRKRGQGRRSSIYFYRVSSQTLKLLRSACISSRKVSTSYKPFRWVTSITRTTDNFKFLLQEFLLYLQKDLNKLIWTRMFLFSLGQSAIKPKFTILAPPHLLLLLMAKAIHKICQTPKLSYMLVCCKYLNRGSLASKVSTTAQDICDL